MATLSVALAAAGEHYRAGRLAAAEQIYRRVVEAAPQTADAWHMLGVIGHQTGRADQAIDCISQAIRIDGGVADWHHNLGIAWLAGRRAGEAEHSFRRAVELNPQFAAAHNSLGQALSEQGRWEEAAASYRQAVSLRPDWALAHSNLGFALHSRGQLDAAIESYRRALDINPSLADARNNLGWLLQSRGELDAAWSCFQEVLRREPGSAAAHNNLATISQARGRTEEAQAGFERAIQLDPRMVNAQLNLATLFRSTGRLAAAVAAYRQAAALKPDAAAIHNDLGGALREQGQLDAAIVSHRLALGLRPDLAEAHNGLGVALREQGRLEEALASLRQAVALKPEYAEAHNNLGSCLKDQGEIEAAIACYRRAVELQPDMVVAHNNLGNALRDLGQLGEALACYREAARLDPNYAPANSNLLYTLAFSPDHDAAAIHAAHIRWSREHAEPLARSIRPHGNDRSPERRLRIGYVSPDFRHHVVGHNIAPLLRERDRQQFEVYCYSDVRRSDPLTDLLRSYADVWRHVVGTSDQRLAEQVREDGIDVLVDLTLHMAHNRLLVFARKPAPVQVTFAGYPGTTGLSAIDYRLSDPYLDPPGLADDYYTEETIRLPDSFWCYDPPGEEPAAGPLPAAQRGSITFGCLNSWTKLNPPLLRLWAGVLSEVERSRLALLVPEGPARAAAREVLAGEGIAPERLDFRVARPRLEYLRYYQDIDISLDALPYNGHTTSLDSLWMGVPLVTLVGRTVAGRAGFSQLMNLGLPELIAQTPEQFRRIVGDLSRDLSRLAELRATLRSRMLSSPLTDAPRFARGVEAAYRQMWRRWVSTAAQAK